MANTVEPKDPVDRWNDNISNTVAKILDHLESSPRYDEFTSSQLEAELQELITIAIDLTENEWDETSRCPHCESESLTHYIEETNNVIQYSDGNSKVTDTHRDKDTLAWKCFECEEILKISPKGLLLDPFKENISGCAALIEALQLVSEEQTSETWKRGEECPSETCINSNITEHTVYAEPAYPQGNTVHCQGMGEVVETVEITCSCCATPLVETKASQLRTYYLF